MSLLNSVKTAVQRPVKINRQSWENFQHGKTNCPSRREKRSNVLMDGREDALALTQARLQLERDTVVSTSVPSRKRKLAETPEDEAPVVKKARMQLERDTVVSTSVPSRKRKLAETPEDEAPVVKKARMQLERDTVFSTSGTWRNPEKTPKDEAPVVKKAPIQLERAPPTVWIIGDSYIRRGEEIARSSLGGDLGVKAKVSWFGWGGLRWRGLVPFFNKSLRGRTAPDVLIIHCGGNDLGGMNTVHLIAEMKVDLLDLHRRFPHMKIMLSDITPRRQWRSTIHPKQIDMARKCVNREMADFILGVEGVVIHHPNILFYNPRLFLRDRVHLSPLGNELFLNDIAESLKSFIK
ncbi:uncharacterized protein LOC111195461 isoform X12 [Astyanax mexicanus]|uniref:uncharacterized protein LOC111195461 isoform X11 n=1 Tax=Astyanax mexicanus TaxID=7994 RepID=UPI0020CB3CE8|nr:uncharacterized protein LOC111195461 isoform X11 [Astyanax mexicanus]XP_049327975.1 uncharacterized protein LOC111195461 isoform X12 [Astyanax mexicanus]